MTAPITAETVLALHRTVWDMPTLAERHPEVIDWLAERWHVAYGMFSDIILVDQRTGVVTGYVTSDLRVALVEALTAELLAEMRAAE